MERQMYGSTHTHFEDLFDTANDKKTMVCEFAHLGAKRVALTGHGNLFAYEDLKDIVKALKDTKEVSEDFEIVPGCEFYFSDDVKHMVVVAKDYEGYKQICKAVTASAKNTKSTRTYENDDQEYLTPVITMEHLREHFKENPGHVYMTTACVGGIFGKELGLEEVKVYKKEVDKKTKHFLEMVPEVKQAKKLIEEWEAITKDPANKKLTKKETEKLEEAIANGDQQVIDELQARQENNERMVAWKEENKKSVDGAKRKLKSYAEAQEKLDLANEKYNEYLATFPERFQKAKDLYYEFEDIFGKENIYFELQNHGLESEKIGFNNIVKLAYEVDNPNFIASNDVHIGDRKGSETFQNSVLRRRVANERRFGFKSVKQERREDEEEYGIKTDSELKEELLKIIKPCTDKNGVVHTAEEIVDSAISNIEVAMEPCHVEFPKISLDGINFYPKFCDDEAKMFREEVEKGLKKKFPNGLPEGYRERIDYEMDIIESMGFSGYLLIVQDYIKYGQLLGYLRTEEEITNAPLSIEELNKYIDDNHIPRVGMGVGPGRGSAAGCLAAYGMDITTVDPIRHGLMFERFLNPSRRSMPDIDTDFKDDIRERLYDYICAKWGYENVSKVCTKAEAHGKAASQIAAGYLAGYHSDGKTSPEKSEIKREYTRVQKNVSEMISKYMRDNGLPETKVENGTMAAKALYEERKDREDNSADFKMEQEILELTWKIAGMPSQISMHACACLISGTPLSEVIPLAWNNAMGKMTTQCLYPQAEELGLLKMDLLNIKNLSVITKVMQDCETMGYESWLNTEEDINKLLLDPRIYKEIFCQGRTNGVFQFESDGMTKMVADFQPRCFEDIVILVAAYRPGPIDFIPEMIAEKWWREKGEASPYGKPVHKINIDNDNLKEILAPTYGVPIYQEQIMKIVQELAGYNMADADNVRKYMSKKKTALLEKERGFFVHGSEHVIRESQKKLDELRALPSPTEEQIKEANTLEAEMKKMPTYIKGCVPNGACTEEEANLLFDAMMEFGKYAFNKSHALCYAQVAMYTAYQKLYFPKLFYKYTLSNETKDGTNGKDKRRASEKYLDEMKSFGIELLPPSATKSEADFTIEDGNIRMGYGCIKGCSYDNLQHADSVQMFIMKNPQISISKQVIPFIKLGMFDKIYHTYSKEESANEKERVAGNRDQMVKWATDYGDLMKRFGSYAYELKHLDDKKKELDDALKLLTNSENSSEELSAIKEEISEISSKHEELWKEYDDIRSFFSNMKMNEMPFRPRTPKECMDDRLYEYEKTGVAFSAKEDVEILTKYGGNRTIDAFNKKRGSMSKYDTAEIAATVVGKTENKSGKGPKFRISLMDKNGAVMQVGSWDKVDPVAEITSGIFTVTGGDYTNLKRVSEFNKNVPPVEVDFEKFSKDKKTFTMTHPLENRTLEFQTDEFEEDLD